MIDLRPCSIRGVGEVFLVVGHPSASLLDWLLSHAFAFVITLYFGTGRITFNDDKSILCSYYTPFTTFCKASAR
jgi:hypothetical protein